MVLYNLGVRLYGMAIRAASLRNSKARAWVRGRSNWQQQLRQVTGRWQGAPVIWVHCASYGEFEQGRPLIEALRRKYPEHRILLSFFSPSGYEPFKNWDGADAVVYLPLDTPRSASAFIEIVNPAATIFIKYEFWLNYLREIRARAIPCYLVSAVFKPHHPFFKWYGRIFRRSLSTFKTLFIQDQRSGELLGRIGISNYLVTGDTRFDRVMQISRENIRFDWLERFKGDARLIVAGSTWPADDEMVLAAFGALAGEPKLLLVPHDVDARSVEQVVERVARSGLSFSLFSKGVSEHARVLVLDTMGMLSRTYAYGNLAYVGGGFDGGIHNSLEPAVFGIPVTFYGNDYSKFNEAVDLLAMGAAVNVKNTKELVSAWQRLLEADQAALIRKALQDYFTGKGRSAEKILESIEVGGNSQKIAR